MDIKLCECGCGKPSAIAKYNNKKRGHIKGTPMRFAPRHSPKGINSNNWNGGRIVGGGRSGKDYILILMPNHPRADQRGYVYEHILVAENILGKSLPPKSCLHHVNCKKHDNRPINLVVCENIAYHRLLHQRMRALKECGHASWRKCWVCKEYDHPDNLYIAERGKPIFHRTCIRIWSNKRRKLVGRSDTKKGRLMRSLLDKFAKDNWMKDAQK